METNTKHNIKIGIGQAIQADPFQSGREAAQIAKSQLNHAKSDLILAFGPSNIHFQDFIEGVRLVTGEENLIGIPAECVATNDLFTPQACVVIILQSEQTLFSIAQAKNNNENMDAIATSILTQFRNGRGNSKTQHEFNSTLLFGNEPGSKLSQIPVTVGNELGLESMVLSITPEQSTSSPLMSADKIIPNGWIGIEMLSNYPWGVGVVSTGAFKGQPNILQDAVKTALRDALGQLKDSKPALGFLFFNDSLKNYSPEDLNGIFKSCQDLVTDVPLISMGTRNLYLKTFDNAKQNFKESVAVTLLPG